VASNVFDLLFRQEECPSLRNSPEAVLATRKPKKLPFTSWNVLGTCTGGKYRPEELRSLTVCVHGRMEEGGEGQALGVGQEARCKTRSNSS
jgi:hypothetical protein